MDVLEKEDLIITCKSGVTIRTKISDIREAGRATQGVTLIRLDEGDEIAATSKIEEQDESAADLEEGAEPTASADGTETTDATDNPETPVVE
jgi:DNA gyrase subunit A